jgi:hypothetical protein
MVGHLSKIGRTTIQNNQATQHRSPREDNTESGVLPLFFFGPNPVATIAKPPQ